MEVKLSLMESILGKLKGECPIISIGIKLSLMEFFHGKIKRHNCGLDTYRDLNNVN
jgi:hypothetical protein